MNFQKYLLIGTSFLGVILSGCSKVEDQTAKVQITIPALRSAAVNTLTVNAPNSISEFNCVAINVTGADIEKEQGLGIVSKLVSAVTGGTLQLSVPRGSARTFQAIGLVSQNQTCPESITKASLLSSTAFPVVAVVGQVVADINGDTTITISNSYQLASAVDLRSGTPLSDGGGGGDTGGGDTGGGSDVPPGTTYCAATEASHFAGGAGTAQYPYLIATAAQWNHIGTKAALSHCSYKLTRDIGFAGQTPTQIGKFEDFSGTIDGNNRTISNGIVPSRLVGGYEYMGLINAAVSTAKIKNLIIESFNINKTSATNESPYLGILMSRTNGFATDHVLVENVTIRNSHIHYVPGGTTFTPYVGFIAGISNHYSFINIKIENSTITGLGPKAYIGGIIGKIDTSKISNSLVIGFSFTASGMSTNMDYHVGGVAGSTGTNAIIEDCLIKNPDLDGTSNSNKTSPLVGLGGAVGVLQGTLRRVAVIGGTLDAGAQVGGLVGSANGSLATMEDSFSDTTITATLSAGGAIGAMNASSTPPPVTRIHSMSTVTNAGTNNRNGLIGLTNFADRINDSYWNKDKGGTTGGGGTTGDAPSITGLNDTEMKTESSFTALHLSEPEGTWFIQAGDYPKLRSLMSFY